MPARLPPAAGEAGGFNAVQKLLTAQSGKRITRITPRSSAELIRVQRSDSNTVVIVVAGQRVAREAECRASGDTDPSGDARQETRPKSVMPLSLSSRRLV